MTQVDDELLIPWNTGHLLYRRSAAAENTGEHDGSTTVPYRFDTQM